MGSYFWHEICQLRIRVTYFVMNYFRLLNIVWFIYGVNCIGKLLQDQYIIASKIISIITLKLIYYYFKSYTYYFQSYKYYFKSYLLIYILQRQILIILNIKQYLYQFISVYISYRCIVNPNFNKLYQFQKKDKMAKQIDQIKESNDNENQGQVPSQVIQLAALFNNNQHPADNLLNSLIISENGWLSLSQPQYNDSNKQKKQQNVVHPMQNIPGNQQRQSKQVSYIAENNESINSLNAFLNIPPITNSLRRYSFQYLDVAPSYRPLSFIERDRINNDLNQQLSINDRFPPQLPRNLFYVPPLNIRDGSDTPICSAPSNNLLDPNNERNAKRRRRFKRPTKLNKQKNNEFSLFILTKKYQQKHKDDQCTICLQNFKFRNKLRVVSCFHKFHKKCIDKWLRKNSFCPNCRFDLKHKMDNEKD